ncbi:MAG: gamma-glutamyl-gamma-aminobutyrate hydrolase family protein [Lentisphaerae bacterium]|nr:gamma-glutamyl-gamma-aminobutyrate hydrolase family protein [Lentisphaerota bacterium]
MRWLVTTSDYRGDRIRNYETWIESAGIAPVTLDAVRPEPAGAASCAALLLSGGGDIAPEAYGALPHPRTESVMPDRDRMEFDWIRRFREACKPVFGICRGLQVLHVAFGGGMIQHIPDLPAAADEPHGTGSDDVTHGIRWMAGTHLADACRSATTVNSHHNQAADPAHPAAGLRIAALSPAGIIEAFESTEGPPVSAVQWHPERLLPREHPASGALLRHWIALVRSPV